MVLKKKPNNVKSKKKRSGKIVCFDEEIVTKESAKKYIDRESLIQTESSDNLVQETGNSSQRSSSESHRKTKSGSLKRKKGRGLNKDEPRDDSNSVESGIISKKRRKKSKDDIGVAPSEDTTELSTVLKKKRKNRKSDKQVEPSEEFGTESGTVSNGKRKKDKDSNDVNVVPSSDKEEDISLEKPSVKQEESIRAKKRKKHAQLVEEKRLKAVVASQQNALNYLSLWKHNRTEWKFEKLKQIWLQQNILDSSKIPNEFWDTVIEYFCGSKGSIRKVILKSALEVIEKEEATEAENTDENHNLILERARNIVQNLQE